MLSPIGIFPLWQLALLSRYLSNGQGTWRHSREDTIVIKLQLARAKPCFLVDNGVTSGAAVLTLLMATERTVRKRRISSRFDKVNLVRFEKKIVKKKNDIYKIKKKIYHEIKGKQMNANCVSIFVENHTNQKKKSVLFYINSICK